MIVADTRNVKYNISGTIPEIAVEIGRVTRVFIDIVHMHMDVKEEDVRNLVYGLVDAAFDESSYHHAVNSEKGENVCQ